MGGLPIVHGHDWNQPASTWSLPHPRGGETLLSQTVVPFRIYATDPSSSCLMFALPCIVMLQVYGGTLVLIAPNFFLATRPLTTRSRWKWFWEGCSRSTIPCVVQD